MIAEDAARSWIGTPYRHAGRVKDVGVDCIGLVLGVAKELGVLAPDFEPPFYEPVNDGSLIAAIFPDYATEVEIDDMAPGDVVVMAFGRNPQHVGIVAAMTVGLRGLSVIHAYAPWLKVVEHPLNDKWLGRIVQVWRVQWVR